MNRREFLHGAATLPVALAPAVRAAAYQPKRINKAIELLEQGQPAYYINAGGGGYEEGRALAKTWADIIMYDMEHAPYDVTRLRQFMKGLADGGPTPSGHRTPAVFCPLPVLGLDPVTFKGASWMVQQTLACGVHGVHLCHARSPEAVQIFVESARFPQQNLGRTKLGEGFRGYGSQKFAAQLWKISDTDYLQIADTWPLNPKGEIMLGVKIEDRHALEHTEETLQIPGLAFAEWGPRDMGLSYGLLSGSADPPYPKPMQQAMERVLPACKRNHLAFLDNVLPDNVKKRIDEGVRIGAGGSKEAAEIGRRYTKRTMPW
ncbi:MAG TPA: hypothetical protein VG675_03715 [Bryobacteraceae bacterium]|nr:hypothetical protein [Bryobacteraceae bacterium]